MRLFIAYMLPDALLDALEVNLESLENALYGRFVRPDMLHVTMAFLGQVEGSQVSRVAGACVQATAHMAPIPCALGGLGYFGKPASSVLWQGFDEGADRMIDDSLLLRRQLDAVGLTYDSKPPNPHITLARKVDVSDIDLPSLAVRRAEGTVDTVAIFRSEQIDGLLTYTPIEEMPLDQGCR